jgi:hypothetical protein
MAKKQTPSSQVSGKNLMVGTKANNKAYNAMWSVANKAPLFLRKAKYTGTGKTRKRATTVRFGKEVVVAQKTNRCTRRHPIRVLMSAATAECAAILKHETDMLRVDADGERESAPFLPALQPGAELLIEHALTAYAQTMFDKATRIRESLNMHKKVTTGSMQAAAEITNRAVFASAGMCPGMVVADSTGGRSRKIRKNTVQEAAVDEALDAPEDV